MHTDERKSEKTVPVRVVTRQTGVFKSAHMILPGGEEIPRIRSMVVSFLPGQDARVLADIHVSDVDVEVRGEIYVTALPSGRRFQLVPMPEGKGEAE